MRSDLDPEPQAAKQSQPPRRCFVRPLRCQSSSIRLYSKFSVGYVRATAKLPRLYGQRRPDDLFKRRRSPDRGGSKHIPNNKAERYDNGELARLTRRGEMDGGCLSAAIKKAGLNLIYLL